MMEMIKILEANTDLFLLLFDALLSLHNVLPPVVIFLAVRLLVLHAVLGIQILKWNVYPGSGFFPIPDPDPQHCLIAALYWQEDCPASIRERMRSSPKRTASYSGPTYTTSAQVRYNMLITSKALTA